MNISAVDNLIRIAIKVNTLESLYNQVRQNCKKLPIRIPLPPKGYSSTTAEGMLNSVGAFLKYLSGQYVTTTEKIGMHVSLEMNKVLASNDEGNFDPDPIINYITEWLIYILNNCGQEPFIDQNQIYPAAANLLRIVNRIRFLESLYQQAIERCSGLENDLEGYGQKYSHWGDIPLTFKETIENIGNYLRFLSGQEMPAFDPFNYQNYDNLHLFDALALHWDKQILAFDEVVEPVISWLNDSLYKCQQV